MGGDVFVAAVRRESGIAAMRGIGGIGRAVWTSSGAALGCRNAFLWRGVDHSIALFYYGESLAG